MVTRASPYASWPAGSAVKRSSPALASCRLVAKWISIAHGSASALMAVASRALPSPASAAASALASGAQTAPALPSARVLPRAS